MDIGSLRKQHDELESLARELLAIVGNMHQPRPVAALRWRLARLLIAHLAVEDRYLYPALLNQNGEAQQVAGSFKAEMGGLAQEFTAYMTRWTDQNIARDWIAFSVETRGVLTALIRRIASENSRLYPLAPAGWRGGETPVGNAA